jgi:eukaryotic-like serine/threonine-protein kinase
VAVDARQIPQTIGKYQILSRIGAGGMAEVFVGSLTGEGGFTKVVAVKRIRPEHAVERAFVEMFMDEARISADLHHPNIAQVYEFGRAGDTYYLAMELVRGVSLHKLQRAMWERRQLAPVAAGAFIVSSVCAALDYAHGRRDADGQPMNIVHRDVSPSNVLCGIEGEVKLIDFGIARAEQRLHETQVTGLKGKFAYMSPEQTTGTGMDHRTDIFGAGVVLYELLAGLNPFNRGDGDAATLERIRRCAIEPPSSLVDEVPPALEQICLRALARRREDRYPTAGQMQAELEAYCYERRFGERQLGEWIKEAFPEALDQTRVTRRPPPDDQTIETTGPIQLLDETTNADRTLPAEGTTLPPEATEQRTLVNHPRPRFSYRVRWALVGVGAALSLVGGLAVGVKLITRTPRRPATATPRRDGSLQLPDRAPSGPDRASRAAAPDRGLAAPDRLAPAKPAPKQRVRPGKKSRSHDDEDVDW